MKKKIFSLIFVSMFMILSLVGGALLMSADSIFLTSTSVSDDGGNDNQTVAQATGNWIDYGTGSTSGGDGSYSNPYTIGSAQMLANLLFMVNVTSSHWISPSNIYIENAYYKLTADIDMSAHYWTPIGNGARQFNGQLDGNGHTISGLYIDKYSADLPSYTTAYEGKYGIGLFGVVGSVTIKDLTIQGGSISVYTNSSASIRMGGVIGMGTTSAYITMSNVISNMSLIRIYNNQATNSAIGGLIGTVYTATINDCFNFSKVEGRSNMILGGLVGTADLYCDMHRCGNFGEVYANLTSASNSGLGGIIGVINEGGSWSILDDCVNYGKVWTEPSNSAYQGSYVGGIIGYGINRVYVNRCINYGEIKSTKIVGGIAGGMGSPQTLKTVYILWIIPVGQETDQKAKEDVLIANCINYGTVTGSSVYGKICGEMNGKDNIQGCYTVSSSNRVGTWQYADGTNTPTFSFTTDNVDYWGGDTIYQTGFYTNPSSSYFRTWHSKDYTGSHNHSVSGWASATVKLNEGRAGYSGTAGYWTITPIIYDYYGGSGHGFLSSCKYSLVPSSLIGTGTLNTQYYRGTWTSHPFDGDEDDKKVMKITFNMISGSSVASSEIGYTNATFYYVKGLTNSVKNSLKFSYHSNTFTVPNPNNRVDVESDSSGIRGLGLYTTGGTSSTPVVNGFNTYTTVNFMAGSTANSATFNVFFQSVAKDFKVKIKVGRYHSTSESSSGAYYEFPNNLSKEIQKTGTYSDDFFISITNLKEKVYYKDDFGLENNANSIRINPNYGYAVFYVLNKATSDSNDDYNANFSVSDNKPLYKYSSGKVESISPSTSNYNDESLGYGQTSAKFRYICDKQLTIYIAPIYYDRATYIREEGASKGSSISMNEWLAFQGVSGTLSEGGAPVSRSRYITFSKVATTGFDNNGYTVSNEMFNFGYTYELYAYCFPNSHESVLNGNENRKLTLTQNQLNTSQQIVADMHDLVKKAVQGSEEARSWTTLHIVVKRTKIPYTISFDNRVNSYSSPSTYNSRTNIGGSSTVTGGSAAGGKFQVGDSVNPTFSAFAGYKNVGTSFANSTSIPSGDVMKINDANKGFQDLLDDYMKDVCGYNVNHSRISSGVLTIYVYYGLQKYNVSYSATVYGENGSSSGQRAPSVTLSSTNSTSSGSIRNVYYYAPATLNVGDVPNANFLGWYLNGASEQLLSLNKEYKFLLNPSVVEQLQTNSTHSDGGYAINLVAKFAKYTFETGILDNAGSSKVLRIKNAKDLIALSSNVRNGQTYDGVFIKLENDIDMSGYVFSPIGTSTTPFKGTFDGQNHIISNLKFVGCDEKYRQSLYDIGLFGYTDGATIKNLTIKDSDFNAYGGAGVFVANATNTTMQHLNNYNSNLSVGEVAFYDVYGQKVTSRSTLEYTTRGKAATISKPAELSGVSHIATLYTRARENFGGLVGKIEGANSSVYACSVNAGVSGSGVSYINGLVGQKTGGTIDQSCVENSVNNSSISLSNTASGVSDSYYRRQTSSNVYSTVYIYNQSTTSTAPTAARTNWFKLANGLWTLRVLYWN